MRHFVPGALLLVALMGACAEPQPARLAHPWRPDANLYAMRSVTERFEDGSWTVMEPCHGLLAANYAWVLADVVAVTEVLESDAEQTRTDADPALYTELSVLRTIRGNPTPSLVIREVCGEWPNGRGHPCFNVYAVGDRVVVGLQKIENTNEGFPTIVLPGLAFVSSDGQSAELFANGNTFALDEYEELLGHAYDQMAPIEPVCAGSEHAVDIGQCPPESILGDAPPTASRSNAWCDPEPYRPWDVHPSQRIPESGG